MGTGFKNAWSGGARSGLPLFVFIAVVVLWAAAFAAPSATSGKAAADSLSDADKACLACHAAQGMKKELASGESLSLHIESEKFASSVHRPIGCGGCHTQVRLPAHPGDAKPIKSAREYAIAQTDNCRTCHESVFRTYRGGMHAARLREGNLAAPTCADCHRPHEVSPPSVQDGPKNACLACHANTLQTHQKWLPNAGRHLEAVACAACHAPDALRKVDLRLYDDVARERLTDRGGTLEFERRARAADANGDGLDAFELRAFLADFNRDGAKVSFRGHIELRNGMEAHEMPVKASAVKECMNCHHERAAPFQRVTVSVIGANGRPQYYDAHNDVLRSALTVDALRGFYAIGGTRIKLLDVLLALGLIGGISVPALHLLIRWFLRRRAKTHDGEST